MVGWPWFVVVWVDGPKERSFEDYGPKWYTVRELDAGYLDHYGQDGREQIFEFAWLPPDQGSLPVAGTRSDRRRLLAQVRTTQS